MESSQPTLDSRLDLEIDSDLLAPASVFEGNLSLTDSSFGRQVEAFTATSSGDIVEDLPEIEAIEDADEELAIALGDATEEHNTAGDNGAFVHTADTTVGGVEAMSMGVVTDP